MDFLGCFASAEGQSFSFDYYPGMRVEPGRSLRLLTMLLGVCALTGARVSNPYHESGAELDLGEQEWFRECLLQGPQSPQLPYLEVKGRSRGIAGPSELETLDQCGWLGAKHVFLPRVLSAIEACPFLDAVKTRLNHDQIRAALVLSRDVTTNLRWVALAPDGSPASPDNGACLACEEFRDFLVDRYLTLMDDYGFRDIEVTGSPIAPCDSPAHGHANGLESLHGAFQGLVEVGAALRENAGHVSCSRPYSSYGAGLAQISDSVSVIAEEHPLPLPDIHIARLFADMGRLYFRRSHSFLLPRRMLANSVGVVPESCPDAPYPGAESYPWYLYHDSAGWRYSLISAIATGLRHRFHALPQDLSESDRAFAVKWLTWEKEHMVRFRHVEEILDQPGLGCVDGYSYTTSRSAMVFLFNGGYDAQKAQLDLKLTYDAEYVVRELYPREYNYLGPSKGLFKTGQPGRRDARAARGAHHRGGSPVSRVGQAQTTRGLRRGVRRGRRAASRSRGIGGAQGDRRSPSRTVHQALGSVSGADLPSDHRQLGHCPAPIRQGASFVDGRGLLGRAPRQRLRASPERVAVLESHDSERVFRPCRPKSLRAGPPLLGLSRPGVFRGALRAGTRV